MGEVHVEIVVVNPRTGARSKAIIALAGTRATLTLIPAGLLRWLGIQKVRTVSLALADGRRAERDVGDAAVAVNGESVPCRVIFGESGDAVLLGLTALEQAGFVVDPVQRRLVPTDFLLY